MPANKNETLSLMPTQKSSQKWQPKFKRRMSNELPADWGKQSNSLINDANNAAEKVATRKASQNVITALAPILPEFVGGSADLTGLNLTSCPSFEHVNGKNQVIIFHTVSESSVWLQS